VESGRVRLVAGSAGRRAFSGKAAAAASDRTLLLI
jgi:hypothetical protein